jgi:hypothetical protein
MPLPIHTPVHNGIEMRIRMIEPGILSDIELPVNMLPRPGMTHKNDLFHAINLNTEPINSI